MGLERAVLLADAGQVTVNDLQIGEQATQASSSGGSPVVRIPPAGIPLEEIERQAVVEALKMSNWVQKEAAELLGMSPSEYLRDVRLKRAHTLLQQSAGNISEIAYAVGFDSLSSFTRAFKTRYGVAPSHVEKLAG